ncbi:MULTISPECIES: SAM-dependent methyltransferase [unclassified Clostridium]|uniref:SAM-dependent methyltransferase n=1 Tax=unclassified Clostridium TaxID=2614128 RepID=UPI0025C5CC79|nr:cyclopropane-fatty-acyl-phospholipid synthase family protein [Clostridium sp.]MDY2630131.1 cyclopropane-fatty-acyl-phospholipid synthase family protein [Clostridium sp.]MDY4253674.1 cyclopropane-fatty-acyl-phospholipid synthase family protein [Clostridium sp.]MDY6227588.1 cyclopropane-fatty-acyl-phospholipid synthase family protein [Clostridium sp.]
MSLESMIIKKYFKNNNAVPFKVIFKDGKELNIDKGDPKFVIKVNGSIDKKLLFTSTSLALGEAYMDKVLDMEAGDLYDALDIVMGSLEEFNVNEGILSKLMHSSTSKKNQKKEVSSHYDIGNDFYELWLDETMSYSCAYFKNEDDTLYEAQKNKVDYILKKLQLKEGMSLLDIGCGWGYLLIEAAKKYKIHGVGITLSEQQYLKFKQRIKEENLEDYLSVQLMDYRDLEKSNLEFDRVVSVGMLEHVSRENYELFFKNVDAVLKDKGLFLLHYISGRKESSGDPWIKKYIFPGGVIPSLREIINIGSELNYYTLDVESLRRHYTKTLLCWYENYKNNIDKISNMFDERFVRMWELYLSSCAASFNNGMIDLHQILFSKGNNNNLEMTRDYLYR